MKKAANKVTKGSDKTKAKVPPQFLFGYKDSKGEIVIPAQYSSSSEFVDGLAPVQQDGLWGLIDKKGQWVTEPKFEFISRAENGWVVFRKDKKFGLAKLNGDEILSPRFDLIVSVGKKAITVKNGTRFSVVAIDGTVLVDDLEFASKWNSVGSVAAATQDGVGLLNEEGKWVVKPSYDAIYDYSEGFAAFDKEGRSGYLDLAGKEAIAPEYEAAYDFSEGLARVQKDGKLGYINKEGKLVIPCVWDEPGKLGYEAKEEATRFVSGFAEVADPEQDFRTGFIDTQGNWVDDISKVPERKLKARELESFREINPEWEKAQEAVVLGARFDKKLVAFKTKLEKAMEKDRPAVIKVFQKIMKDYEGKKVRFLQLAIAEDHELVIYEEHNYEADLDTYHPFKAINKVFEGGVMQEPTIKKAVDLLRKFYEERSDQLLDWCFEVWKEAGGANFKIPAYMYYLDEIIYVDLKTGKRVENIE